MGGSKVVAVINLIITKSTAFYHTNSGTIDKRHYCNLPKKMLVYESICCNEGFAISFSIASRLWPD
jgi:hypothetical protein